MKDPNENRPGYKKTKVGWIPEEWESLRIESFSTLRSGGTPSRQHPEYWDGAIPWATTAEIKYGLITCTTESITEDGLKKSSAALFPKGTLVMAMYGQGATRGRVGILGKPMAFNQACLAILPKKRALPPFMYQRLTFDYHRVRSFSQGGNQANLSGELVGGIRVPLPELYEQQKIAEILSTWDEAIERTRKLIEAKKRRKKGLMQQLLTGKKRLPGFANTMDAMSHRFFDLPADWEYVHMRDIANQRSERNGSDSNSTVLTCSKHGGFVQSTEYFGKRVFSEDTSNYKVVRKGWFGFPANHVEEGSIGLLLDHEVGIVSPIYVVFSVSERIVPEYLYAVFKTDTFRHIFSISTNASVDRRGSLRWREFRLIRVPVPSVEEQKAIVDVLVAADEDVDLQERELSALEKQKRGLMQMLLTGTVRVKV